MRHACMNRARASKGMTLHSWSLAMSHCIPQWPRLLIVMIGPEYVLNKMSWSLKAGLQLMRDCSQILLTFPMVVTPVLVFQAKPSNSHPCKLTHHHMQANTPPHAR